ncbi:MAG: hypothetical protein AVDCRST_MAG56-6 [uncultured Cytophagales bacterium]|uniref:Uncharacterized protein n=1 Tax=uncultured Cytophagales bacterium TaxID=158755 RepID=A0A6J4H373_9SPHI|nr:MAG: hypothetical protein AVDCRST_MAG56-6 [uncultured Cytophagales bacterium]
MMQPDQQSELLPAARAAHESPPAGTAPDENAMIAGLARKLAVPPAAPALLGTDLPLLASQVAAVHSYRHAYGPAADLPGPGAVTPIAGPFAKGIAIADPSAKPAGPGPSADAQSGKPVNLKRRKVNANRFRARPNKPPE